MQSFILGSLQIAISFVVNLIIALSAAGLATWFAHNPFWLKALRTVMGCVLAALAIRLVTEEKRALS